MPLKYIDEASISWHVEVNVRAVVAVDMQIYFLSGASHALQPLELQAYPLTVCSSSPGGRLYHQAWPLVPCPWDLRHRNNKKALFINSSVIWIGLVCVLRTLKRGI